MIPIRTALILMGGLLLTACASSPPVQFFTLNPTATLSTVAPRADTTLQVVAVHIPALLDRQEMVRKTSANTIRISDRHRWAAPLDRMVQRVLTQDLAQRLPVGAVIPPDQPAPPGTARIVIDILQFETDASGTVVFGGSWSLLRQAEDDTIQNAPLHLHAMASATDYAAQAQAMSRIIGQIADAIAARLTSDTGANGGKR